MFATWPMVVGALVAGFIAGFLIPVAQQKAPTSSAATAKTETAKTTEPKRALPPATTASAPAPTKNDTAAVKSEAAATTKNAGTEDCERQTWPYLTPNCLDRSAQAATPDVVVKTKRAETDSATVSEPKVEAKTAEPKSVESKAVEAKAQEVKAPDVKPQDQKAQQAAGTPAPVRETAKPKPEPASRTQAGAATAAVTNETSESAPVDSTPERSPIASTPERTPVAATPERAPAASTPEKNARRPAARARAEATDEPLRPRQDRYRTERRYAGQDDDYERPVYIERGGRLYLAPEYHYRLRGPDRYWRE